MNILARIMHIACTQYIYDKFFQIYPQQFGFVEIWLQNNLNPFNTYYRAIVHIFLKSKLFCAPVCNFWNYMPFIVLFVSLRFSGSLPNNLLSTMTDRSVNLCILWMAWPDVTSFKCWQSCKYSFFSTSKFMFPL